MVPQRGVEQLVLSKPSGNRDGRRAVPVVLALVLLATGCSTPDARPPDVWPLDGATRVGYRTTVALHDRQEQLIAACMTSRGKTYRQQPSGSSQRAATTNPYGLVTLDSAKTDGYGIVGDRLATHAAPAAGDGENSDALLGTQRQTVTLRDGTVLTYPTDGCVHQAAVSLYGQGWEVLEAQANALDALVLTAVEQRPAYADAVKRWSSCMDKAGHPFPDLAAARKSIADHVDTPDLQALGQAEIKLAKADAHCQADEKLAATIAHEQADVEAVLLTPDDHTLIQRYTAALRSATASLPG